MSAFFVHDLKNTASVLTLTLKNFPLHYQDPAFREDALRGMAKTVEHVNNLIDRLGALRHELTIRTVDCDLNDVVNATLRKQPQPSNICARLGIVPRIHLDPEAMDKVLSNLLLNAREASGQNEAIEVITRKRNGWVVLEVRDKGCGMAADFVRDSLFRPFRSTKKRGLGIGMFHCKMIVEAHRGKIEVESTPGEGSSFQILLPENFHN
jgi:signal transduction histidine kinase